MSQKLTICIVVLILTLGTLAQCQPVRKPLAMTATVVSKRYCKVGSKNASLLIKFRLVIVNSTREEFTIGRPIYPIARVSGSLDELRQEKYEFSLHAPDVISTRPDQKVSPRTDLAGLTTVKPGRSFVVNTMEITFPTSLGTNYSKRSALRPGRHFVELVMSVGIKGTSELVPITSKPTVITIENNPSLQNCR